MATNIWKVPSRRACRLIAEGRDLKGWLAAARFPAELMHPVIVRECRLDYARERYEPAVFNAFREVELAVREAGGFTNSDYGVPLMRRAFDPKNGPLTDPSAEPAERDAMASLFAGAIGLFKNPSSHRRVEFENSGAVLEALMLAGHLLRIVDDRIAHRNKVRGGTT
jgi:uncharacterized protein (TIGR02391 family)